MAGPDRLYLFDAGPLLCFAAVSPDGPELLRKRYAGRCAVVADVRAELAGLTRSDKPGVARAASNAHAAYRWVPTIEVDDEDIVRRANDLTVRLEAFKRRPKPTSHPSQKDWGECVTLAYAESLTEVPVVVVASNDDAARGLARSLSVDAVTVVDILRRLVSETENTLTRNQAYNMTRVMVDAGLDIGDVVRDLRDL